MPRTLMKGLEPFFSDDDCLSFTTNTSAYFAKDVYLWIILFEVLYSRQPGEVVQVMLDGGKDCFQYKSHNPEFRVFPRAEAIFCSVCAQHLAQHNPAVIVLH